MKSESSWQVSYWSTTVQKVAENRKVQEFLLMCDFLQKLHLYLKSNWYNTQLKWRSGIPF